MATVEKLAWKRDKERTTARMVYIFVSWHSGTSVSAIFGSTRYRSVHIYSDHLHTVWTIQRS